MTANSSLLARGLPGLALAAVLGGLLAGAPPATAGPVDLEIFSQYATGRFGSEEEGDLTAVTLALATGQRVRFRLEVPYVETRSPRAVLLAQLGITPRLLLSITPERRRAILARLEERRSGLGDLRFEVAGGLAGGGTKLYRLEGELEVKVPTADEERFLGTGEWDARVGLAAERRTWSLTLFGGGGWSHLGDSGQLALDDVADGYFGVESEPVKWGLQLSTWLAGNSSPLAETGARLVLGAGVRSTGRRTWQASLTVGLTEDAEELGLQLGVGFQPRRGVRRP